MLHYYKIRKGIGMDIKYIKNQLISELVVLKKLESFERIFLWSPYGSGKTTIKSNNYRQ